MTAVASHFIAGEEQRTGAQEVVRFDPADLRQPVVSYCAATEAELDAAAAAAAAAAPGWARTPGPQRAAVLHAAASLLEEQLEQAAAEITAEEGKTLREARGEVLRAVTTFRHAAEQARAAHGELADAEEPGTLIATRRRPLGVVGLITPWNFPLAIPVRKGAPALAFGNTVVLKPASATPSSALRLARVLAAAGLPAGAWNVVVGDGAIGQRLVRDERIAGISFTGSTAVGRAIGQELAARGAPFQGEMGGHSPVVVLADGDPERVAEIVAKGAFASAGQTCTATRRLIVVDEAYDAVLDAVVPAVRALRVGPGTDPATEICPLVGGPERDAVGAAIERTVAAGARVLCGGECPGGELAHGAYLSPALLGDVSAEMDIATEEVFGPVCAVLRAAGPEDAIRLANAVPYGLSASVVTRDIGSATRFLREIEAGMVHVNRETVGADPHMPFGGIKDSGVGPREQGSAARDFFTHQQTVYLHP